MLVSGGHPGFGCTLWSRSDQRLYLVNCCNHICKPRLKLWPSRGGWTWLLFLKNLDSWWCMIMSHYVLNILWPSFWWYAGWKYLTWWGWNSLALLRGRVGQYIHQAFVVDADVDGKSWLVRRLLVVDSYSPMIITVYHSERISRI